MNNIPITNMITTTIATNTALSNAHNYMTIIAEGLYLFTIFLMLCSLIYLIITSFKDD